MPQDLVPPTPSLPLSFRAPSAPPAPAPIWQLLYVIFKWRRLVFGLGLAFTLAAIIVAFLKPTSRPATAKILFKPDRAALQISGLSGATARLGYSPQVLQSEVELFRSRSVLLPVATALLAGQNPSPEGLEGKTVSLRNNLVVTTLPETNIIQVTYSAATAEDAERTLDLIVKQYMEQHALAYRDSPGVLAFYEKETSRAAADLQKAEEALTKWQEANSTVSIDTEITSQLEKLATLERSLNQTEADIQATAARLTGLQGLAKAQPARAVMSRETVPNPLIAKLEADVASAEIAMKEATNTPLVGKLKTDVIAAEVALEDLRRRYTDRDRVVVEKKEQVAMLREELASAERAAVAVAQERLKQTRAALTAVQTQASVAGRETTGPNPARESLERDMVVAKAHATALASQRDALRQQARDAATGLATLRDKKVGVDRLMRNVTVARDSYLMHSRRLEDAKIAAGLDRQQLSDVAVIEPPYVTPDSDLTRRLMIVALACVVGVGLGVAAAFTIEFFNNSVRTAEDVRFSIGLPVVATIPVLPQSATSLALPTRATRVERDPVDRA